MLKRWYSADKGGSRPLVVDIEACHQGRTRETFYSHDRPMERVAVRQRTGLLQVRWVSHTVSQFRLQNVVVCSIVAGDEADKEFEKVAKRFKKKEEAAKEKASSKPKKPHSSYRGNSGGNSQAYWAQRLAMPPPPPPPLPHSQGSALRVPKSQMRCNNCGEFGHFVRECTKSSIK